MTLTPMKTKGPRSGIDSGVHPDLHGPEVGPDHIGLDGGETRAFHCSNPS